MNDDNFLSVRRIGNAVRDGLGPYVLAAYKIKYSKGQYLQCLQETLRRDYAFDTHNDALETLDLQSWLHAMQYSWSEVFSKKLGHTAPGAARNPNVCNAQSFLYELLNTRNLFSHEAPRDEFSDDDVFRIADTASRLLRAANKRNEAAKTEEIKLEYGSKLYQITSEISILDSATEGSTPAEAEGYVSEGQSIKSLGDDASEQIKVLIDLSSLNLSGVDLRGRNLHLANLMGADLSGANLERVQLTNMNLSNVKLSKSNLTGANLGGSNLSHSVLSDARAWFADLRSANLSHAKMERIGLREAKMDYADFSHANLTKADLSNSEEAIGASSILDAYDDFDRLYGVFRCQEVSFEDAILRQANFQRTFLEPANLTGADMTGADFSGSRIASCRLSGAILDSANLSKCHILSCDFSGAKMHGVDLSKSDCVYSKFANSDMSGANLSKFMVEIDDDGEDYSWDNVVLSEANLSGAVLSGLSFRNADLTGAVFMGADLSKADLSHSDLMDTNFKGADLRCAKFEGAKFRYSTKLPDGTYWDEDTNIMKFTRQPGGC